MGTIAIVNLGLALIFSALVFYSLFVLFFSNDLSAARRASVLLRIGVGVLVAQIIAQIAIKMGPLTLPDRQAIIEILSQPWAIILCFLAALGLYCLRGLHPLLYGFLELLVATGTIWFVIKTPDQDVIAKIIGIAGGIYVMVRAIDDVDKGLPERCERFLPPWMASSKHA